jgi:hypothetical protein
MRRKLSRDFKKNEAGFAVVVPCLPRHPRLEHRPTGAATPPAMAPWRGGRVVDRTALEMRHRCKPIGGSNPSLSAIAFLENQRLKLYRQDKVLLLLSAKPAFYFWKSSPGELFAGTTALHSNIRHNRNGA